MNSRLRGKPERADAAKLVGNSACSFVGSIVLGMGFTLTAEQRDALVASDPRNAERIFPYLGGKEVNTSPTQHHDRYVISFGHMTLDEAQRWPELVGIIRDKVKPERDRLRKTSSSVSYKRYWWQFGRPSPALYDAIVRLDRCLVTARVSKHLMLSAQPTDRIVSEQLYVFPLQAHTAFAVLQSRVHEVWARLLSSSMKTDLRYAASDCFETFPFPEPDPRAVIDSLETIGQQLYETRAKFMIDTDQGLTKTYNALKDAANTEPRVLELRRLHEQMDRAVLDAYGWTDIQVPPFCPGSSSAGTEADRAALTEFEDEVIDRLYVLNAERAQEEERLGLRKKKTKAKAKPKPRSRKPKTPNDDKQGKLF